MEVVEKFSHLQLQHLQHLQHNRRQPLAGNQILYVGKRVYAANFPSTLATTIFIAAAANLEMRNLKIDSHSHLYHQMDHNGGSSSSNKALSFLIFSVNSVVKNSLPLL